MGTIFHTAHLWKLRTTLVDLHTIIIYLINKFSAKLSFQPLTSWKLYKIPLQRKGNFPQLGSIAINRIQFSTWLLALRFKLVPQRGRRNSFGTELKEAEKSQMYLSAKTQNFFNLSWSLRLISLVKILKSNQKTKIKGKLYIPHRGGS